MTIPARATLALSVLLAATTGRGEEPGTGVPRAALPPRARIRLTLADGHRRSYDLLRVEDGALVVQPRGLRREAALTIRLAEVRAAELSRGRHRRPAAAKGMLIGAGVGVAAMILAQGWCGTDSAVPCVPLFVMSGSALGAGMGAAFARERWTPVPIGGHGPRVQGGVSLRF